MTSTISRPRKLMSTELTGRRLGVYQLHERVGAGGMGEVYRARDTQLRSRRRDQDPARRVRRRSRSARALRARSARPRVAQSSEHRRHPRPRRRGRRPRAGDGAGRGRDARRSDRARADARSTRRCRSRGRLPTRSTPRTSTASSIAISSRPTSRSRSTARSRCWTSVWPRRRTGDERRSGRRRNRRRSRPRRRTDGRHPRHRRVHEPRAGARAAGRQAHRHLGVRVRALRDAHRPARVCAATRSRTRSPRSSSASPTGTSVRAAAPAPVSSAAQAVPREGCQAAAARHRRCAYPDRRDPRRAASSTAAIAMCRAGDPCHCGRVSRLACSRLRLVPQRMSSPREAHPRPTPVQLTLSFAGQIADVAITSVPSPSPDGGRFVFIGTDEKGTTSLWIRAIESSESRMLPGTEGATDTDLVSRRRVDWLLRRRTAEENRRSAAGSRRRLRRCRDFRKRRGARAVSSSSAPSNRQPLFSHVRIRWRARAVDAVERGARRELSSRPDVPARWPPVPLHVALRGGRQQYALSRLARFTGAAAGDERAVEGRYLPGRPRRHEHIAVLPRRRP